jgi:hypothetical protein
LDPSRIPMAAATIAIGAGLLMMPAHSQLSDGLRLLLQPPSQEQIDIYVTDNQSRQNGSPKPRGKSRDHNFAGWNHCS